MNLASSFIIIFCPSSNPPSLDLTAFPLLNISGANTAVPSNKPICHQAPSYATHIVFFADFTVFFFFFFFSLFLSSLDYRATSNLKLPTKTYGWLCRLSTIISTWEMTGRLLALLA